MNTVKLNFTKKSYPYPDESYDPKIFWGEISVWVISQNGIQVKKILELEWDLRYLINWFDENKTKLLTQECPFIMLENKNSIAENIYYFYNIEGYFDESLLDELFEYRESHGLDFGLRGTDTPEIYMGKNGNHFEVSFFEKDLSWKFKIEVESFFTEIEEEFGFLIEKKNLDTD